MGEQTPSSFEERFSIEQDKMNRETLGSRTPRSSRRKKSGNTLVKAIAAAGVVITTLAVMLVIFQGGEEAPGSAEPGAQEVPGATDTDEAAPLTLSQLAERLKLLERSFTVMSEQKADERAVAAPLPLDMTVFSGRLERVETAMTSKFSIMIENIDNLELEVARLKNRLNALEKGKPGFAATTGSAKTHGETDAKGKMAPSSAGTEDAPVVPSAPKTALKKSTKKAKVTTPAQPVKEKAVSSHQYHVVKKGETFFSISQKYGTTVARIQELNHFSTRPILYPGDKLIVK